MADPALLAAARDGSDAIAQWRARQPAAALDLGDADLTGLNLPGADLRGADLSNAGLEGADLRGTDLRDSDLRETDLRGARLDDADVGGAILGVTRFEKQDLRELRGLETARHELPSDLPTSCLRLSGGHLTTNVLRGFGLEDWEILSSGLYDPAIDSARLFELQYRIYDLRAERGMQRRPLFLAFVADDRDVVDQVATELIARRIRFWRHAVGATKRERDSGRIERVRESLDATTIVLLSRAALADAEFTRRLAALYESRPPARICAMRIEDVDVERKGIEPVDLPGDWDALLAHIGLLHPTAA